MEIPDWIESHPFKMAVIASLIVLTTYSIIYLEQFGNKEMNGLLLSIPIIFGFNFSMAGLFNLSERKR